MPMKSTRTISISMHDGLHSLKRLNKFFHLPEEKESQLIDKNIEFGHIVIKKDTRAAYPNSTYRFTIKCNFHIELNRSQRLNVIARKSHGCTSFLEMLMGGLKKINKDGKVLINGRISYKPEKPFFIK